MKKVIILAAALAVSGCSWGDMRIVSEHGYEAHWKVRSVSFGLSYDPAGRPVLGFQKRDGFLVIKPTLTSDGGKIACIGNGVSDGLSYIFVERTDIDPIGADIGDGSFYAGGCAAQILAASGLISGGK